MKKMLNEWKNFLKENSENQKNDLLDKVRDIFFGAYNSWEPEYKKLHDKEFEDRHKKLVVNAKELFNDEEKIIKTTNGANIGLSLYWTDYPRHGIGDNEAALFLIKRKLDILESMLSDEEKKLLKNGLMQQIIDEVREDRSNKPYPVPLAISVGVINGFQVDDAYMTSAIGINRHVIPILSDAGYYKNDQTKPPLKTKKKRRKRDAKLSLADMKAMMDKFSN